MSTTAGFSETAGTGTFRIGIADDNPIVHKLLIKVLQKHLGLTIAKEDTFTDGLAVLEALGKHRYDLFLMDADMPILNGYDTVRKIRFDPAHSPRSPTDSKEFDFSVSDEASGKTTLGCDKRKSSTGGESYFGSTNSEQGFGSLRRGSADKSRNSSFDSDEKLSSRKNSMDNGDRGRTPRLTKTLDRNSRSNSPAFGKSMPTGTGARSFSNDNGGLGSTYLDVSTKKGSTGDISSPRILKADSYGLPPIAQKANPASKQSDSRPSTPILPKFTLASPKYATLTSMAPPPPPSATQLTRAMTGTKTSEAIRDAMRSGMHEDADLDISDESEEEAKEPELTVEEKIVQFSKAIRSTNRTMPIIGITANSLYEDRLKCLNVGMDEVLTKPFDPETISAMVGRFVNVKRRAAQIRRLSITSALLAVTDDATAALNNPSNPTESFKAPEKIFDAEHVDTRLGGNTRAATILRGNAAGRGPPDGDGKEPVQYFRVFGETKPASSPAHTALADVDHTAKTGFMGSILKRTKEKYFGGKKDGAGPGADTLPYTRSHPVSSGQLPVASVVESPKSFGSLPRNRVDNAKRDREYTTGSTVLSTGQIEKTRSRAELQGPAEHKRHVTWNGKEEEKTLSPARSIKTGTSWAQEEVTRETRPRAGSASGSLPRALGRRGTVI